MQESPLNPEYGVVRREPILASLLSFLFMGLGQAYNGQRKKGCIFYFSYYSILFILFFIFKFFHIPISQKNNSFQGVNIYFLINFLVFKILSVYDAYRTARSINNGTIKIDSTIGHSLLIYLITVIGFSIVIILSLIIIVMVFRPFLANLFYR